MTYRAPLAVQFYETCKDVEHASTLPAMCYTSDDWHKKEQERIFAEEWLCVGREQKVAKKGDFFTIKFGNEPVVVVRDQRNEVRAFLNVCRHRGARIASGSGNTKTLVCGYHCWTYTLSGELIVVPGTPDPMVGAADFDRSKYGLLSVRLEKWEGFLFINFSNNAPSLSDWLGGLPSFLANYRLSHMEIHKELSYDVKVNWKVFVENTMESYHAGFVHKKFLSPDVDQGWRFLETDGPFEAMYSDKSIMDFGNLPAIEGLDDRQKAGLFHIWVHPNLTIHVSSTYMTFRQYIPVDAETMRIQYTWCFHPETIAHERFPEVVANYYEKSVEILTEDIDYVPIVQEGLRASNNRPGRYSPSEYIVQKVAKYVIEKVEGSRAVPANY
jgi:choline monooxygenase